jgi:Contractile injection system tube protein
MALEKATITNTVSGNVIEVLFNPEEYTVNSEVTYAQSAIPGVSGPLLQFVHGNMSTLEMELLLDTQEKHVTGRNNTAANSDVRVLVRAITDLMAIESTTHAPPVLLFTWGSLTFTCVLARASQKYQMFLPTGIPVRARMQVTFNEFRNIDLEAKEIKRQTADYTKRRVVGQGETLSSIAAEVYDDPGKWRPLAIANAIEDPRVLPSGLELVVPRLPYRDPTTSKVHS